MQAAEELPVELSRLRPCFRSRWAFGHHSV